MNAKQIQLVQESFLVVKPIAYTAATLFYERLFLLDPSLRPYFKADLTEQKGKLMSTLGYVVFSLDRPERIIPSVQALGKRHAGYGVEPGHYETVGAALIWTLDKGLGDLFTPEVEEAWIAAYNLLAGVMIEAAERRPV